MGFARNAATRSADPRTQVGCVAVTKDKAIVATGYNGFTYGHTDTNKAWQNKDAYVVHAEENLICHAGRLGGSPLRGVTVYSTLIPCLRCTRLLIQCGVAAVVYEHDNTTGYKSQWVEQQWGIITELFRYASIDLKRLAPDGLLEPSSCNFSNGDVPTGSETLVQL